LINFYFIKKFLYKQIKFNEFFQGDVQETSKKNILKAINDQDILIQDDELEENGLMSLGIF